LFGESIALPVEIQKNFYTAIDEAKKVPENMWPKRIRGEKRRVKDDAFEGCCSALSEKRDAVAAELDIEASLVISKASIEAISANEVESASVLMQWQRELLDL